MSEKKQVELPINEPAAWEWRKATWRKRFREMAIGEKIEIGSDYMERQSRFVNAKNSVVGSKWSVRKDRDEGKFYLTRLA